MISATQTSGQGELVGQSEVQAALQRLVSGTGGAVLLEGEAGIGKSSLLDDLAARADGRRVLRAVAVETEVELPFATVSDLVMPLRDRFGMLPPAQAVALERALALSDGPPPAPYAVCAATLGLLSSTGLERPLLILVDDFHWVDAASRQVLLFVARRLAEERVSIVLTARGDELPGGGQLGIDVLRIPPLDPRSSVELVRRRAGDTAPYVAQALARQTGGNPLALLESVASMTRAQRRGRTPLDDPVPATVTETLWGPRLARLSERAALALLLVATARTSELGDIARALAHQDLDERDLAAAEAAGLLDIRDHLAALRHPLLRSAVLHRATSARIRQAHRTWSEVCAPEERPWFLAAASHPPDAAVAAALDTAAEQALARGAVRTAAEAAVRAAEFSADPAARAARLAAAAGWALMGEAPHEAAAIGTEALRHTNDPMLRARIDLVLGRAVTWLGDVVAGHDRFAEAAAAVAGTDPLLAAQLWAEAAVPAVMSGRIGLANADADQALSQLPADGVRSPGVVAAVAQARLIGGGVAEGTALLDAARGSFDATEPVADLQAISIAGHTRIWAQQTAEARILIDGAVDAARGASAPLVLPYTLAVRSELDRWTGRWTSAYADAHEAVRWGRELSQAGATGYALACLALIDAARGDGARCRRRLAAIRSTTAQLGLNSMDTYVAASLGLCLLGENDLESAATQLELAHRIVTEQGVGCPTVVPYAGDLVEALVRTGRTERAAELVDWLDDVARRTGLPWPAAIAARGRGLTAATPDAAGSAFAEAYDALRRAPSPFDRARTQLCHGEVLRRMHRPTAARTYLEAALDGFEALGAQPWAHRASTELAATGKRRAPNGERLVELTPQESQVATAVARGLSNPEVAAALFVSRKTVEAHLSRVYRKLGVRSRTELTLRINEVTTR